MTTTTQSDLYARADARVRELGIDVEEYVRLTSQHVADLGSCVWCGEPIIKAWNDGQRAPRNDRRYCSGACRTAAYRSRRWLEPDGALDG